MTERRLSPSSFEAFGCLSRVAVVRQQQVAQPAPPVGFLLHQLDPLRDLLAALLHREFGAVINCFTYGFIEEEELMNTAFQLAVYRPVSVWAI